MKLAGGRVKHVGNLPIRLETPGNRGLYPDNDFEHADGSQ